MNDHFRLSIYDLKGIKANYHTHTKRCKHAEGEDREYVEAAIKAGYKALGFSDHTPYPFGDSYVSPISILVICQEIFKKDFDMFFLKKGALHPRS